MVQVVEALFALNSQTKNLVLDLAIFFTLNHSAHVYQLWAVLYLTGRFNAWFGFIDRVTEKLW